MQPPPTNPDSLFEKVLQDMPPSTEVLARQTKAFVRPRNIQNVAQLLRMVLLYSALDKSLREVAAVLLLLGIEMCEQSVRERLENCLPWVKALIEEMLKSRVMEELPGAIRLLVVDGSSVQGPGAKGIDYRLHICINLLTFEMVEVQVSDKRKGESFRNFSFKPGDVIVGDRGFCRLGAIFDLVERQIQVIVRLHYQNCPLYHRSGQALNLAEELKNRPLQDLITLPVALLPPKSSSKRQPVEAWVHACRLPEDKAAQARRKCYSSSKKYGNTPKEETLYLCGWLIVLTTLSPAILPRKMILKIYKARWQVEMSIKVWKSVIDIDLLRTRAGSPLGSLYLHGKLLYILFIDKRLRSRSGTAWRRLDMPRKLTRWRPIKMVREALHSQISASAFWPEDLWERCLEVLAERPRHRELHLLSREVCRALQSLQSSELELSAQTAA